MPALPRRRQASPPPRAAEGCAAGEAPAGTRRGQGPPQRAGPTYSRVHGASGLSWCSSQLLAGRVRSLLAAERAPTRLLIAPAPSGTRPVQEFGVRGRWDDNTGERHREPPRGRNTGLEYRASVQVAHDHSAHDTRHQQHRRRHRVALIRGAQHQHDAHQEQRGRQRRAKHPRAPPRVAQPLSSLEATAGDDVRRRRRWPTRRGWGRVRPLWRAGAYGSKVDVWLGPDASRQAVGSRGRSRRGENCQGLFPLLRAEAGRVRAGRRVRLQDLRPFERGLRLGLSGPGAPRFADVSGGSAPEVEAADDQPRTPCPTA